MKKIVLKSNENGVFLTEFFIAWDKEGNFLIPDLFIEIERSEALKIVNKNSSKVISFLNNKDPENLTLDLYTDSDSIRWIVSFAN